MPLLCALDEYNLAMSKIFVQAIVSLESDNKDYLKAAITIIMNECLLVDDAVSGLLEPINNGTLLPADIYAQFLTEYA